LSSVFLVWADSGLNAFLQRRREKSLSCGEMRDALFPLAFLNAEIFEKVRGRKRLSGQGQAT